MIYPRTFDLDHRYLHPLSSQQISINNMNQWNLTQHKKQQIRNSETEQVVIRGRLHGRISDDDEARHRVAEYTGNENRRVNDGDRQHEFKQRQMLRSQYPLQILVLGEVLVVRQVDRDNRQLALVLHRRRISFSICMCLKKKKNFPYMQCKERRTFVDVSLTLSPKNELPTRRNAGTS